MITATVEHTRDLLRRAWPTTTFTITTPPMPGHVHIVWCDGPQVGDVTAAMPARFTVVCDRQVSAGALAQLLLDGTDDRTGTALPSTISAEAKLLAATAGLEADDPVYDAEARRARAALRYALTRAGGEAGLADLTARAGQSA